MSLIGRIRNSLPQSKPLIVNTGPDKGIGSVGVAMTTSNSLTPTKDLTDLQLVTPNIQNARRAVEIDPTAWSSLASLTIMATKDKITITGDPETDEDPGADPKAVAHIRKKVREWNLDSLTPTTVWKGLVDGRCFIENYIPPATPSIKEVVPLAFDAQAYDCIELKDPYTMKVVGYMQKATIYPIPSNWQAMGFDELKNRQSETKEIPFTDVKGYIPVFMPKFFVGDGNSEGFVFKALDDVYCLKTVKNMMPSAAKMASTTVFVKVGNKDFPFKPYEDVDDTNTKISKSEARMKAIGDNFKEKFKKEVILGDGGIDVGMVGDGKLVDLPGYANFFKQEIRESLLTPDSRFSSANSNRAVSQEQMSGSAGQVTVVEYIEQNYIVNWFEKYIFDLELKLNGFHTYQGNDNLGKIHIGIGEKDTENELELSQVADSILKYRPDIFDLVVNEYYPRLASVYDKSKPKEEPPQEGITNSMPRGFKDNGYDGAVINAAKTILEENGDLI